MNRWYFWVLAPVMLASAVTIPITAAPSSLLGWAVAYGISLILVLTTVGLANPVRFEWALRAVAGLVALAGVGYFASELAGWMAGTPLGLFGRRSQRSLWNATLFLLLFGVPALRYLLFARTGPDEEIGFDLGDGVEEEFPPPAENSPGGGPVGSQRPDFSRKRQ